LDELNKVRQRIDSFNWMDADFPKSKVFNLRELYRDLKALEAGKLKIENGKLIWMGSFWCELPQEEAMKQELLANRKSFYKIVFSLARVRLDDRSIGQKCLLLMRDLIISEIMLDDGLLGQMRSSDPETKLSNFTNFYEDYKNHLPNSLGLQVANIKGLRKCFEDFSSEVYAQIAKVKVVRQAGGESYWLRSQGFLSIFRGRAGIIDCTFDMDDMGDMGDAYTRAMHEDTLYLFVYKGKELKGYIGLMFGQTQDKKKILTIDTINSPSLDGPKLLGNLFRGLNDLAMELGCSGIALPGNMAPSFNFDNKKTIKKMAEYKKAVEIQFEPMHKESWELFTKEYGKHQYDSIEKGKFKLLEIAASVNAPEIVSNSIGTVGRETQPNHS
jgi:hypothetical protein